MKEKTKRALNIKASQVLISKKHSFWVRIVSWSMVPLVKKGDRLLIKKVTPSILRPGDIICFKRGSFLVTHRIYSISEKPNGKQVFVTKPDSKDKLDLPISSKDILGKVVVLQRRSKNFDLGRKIFKIWGMILITSHRLYPSLSVLINKLVLKILKSGIIKGVFLPSGYLSQKALK